MESPQQKTILTKNAAIKLGKKSDMREYSSKPVIKKSKIMQHPQKGKLIQKQKEP